jgi:hypothetical protein
LFYLLGGGGGKSVKNFGSLRPWPAGSINNYNFVFLKKKKKKKEIIN